MQQLGVQVLLVVMVNVLTHLGRSVLRRSLACAELSLAVAFPSIIVIPIIATCTRAHHTRTGHVVVEGRGIIGRCWAGRRHLVRISCAV